MEIECQEKVSHGNLHWPMIQGCSSTSLGLNKNHMNDIYHIHRTIFRITWSLENLFTINVYESRKHVAWWFSDHKQVRWQNSPYYINSHSITGEGSYSSVYKVKRLTDNTDYALKKVKLTNLSDKERQNALEEVRILASIRNINMIAYKEAFIDEPTDSLW